MTTRLERIRNLCECLNEVNDDISNLKTRMSEMADEIERRISQYEFYTGRIAVLSNMEHDPDETYDSDEDKYIYSYHNKNPFMKPSMLSNRLAQFLGVETGTEWPRLRVTKHVFKYIKDNNLQDKDDKRKINPDEKLSKLLMLKKTDKLTYYNIHNYLSPYFT